MAKGSHHTTQFLFRYGTITVFIEESESFTKFFDRFERKIKLIFLLVDCLSASHLTIISPFILLFDINLRLFDASIPLRLPKNTPSELDAALRGGTESMLTSRLKRTTLAGGGVIGVVCSVISSVGVALSGESFVWRVYNFVLLLIKISNGQNKIEYF